jgi:hypothetical protein
MQITSLRDTISYPMYATEMAGTALAYWQGLSTKTQFPRWFLIFIPTSLSMASSVFRNYFLMIPAPIGGIIWGKGLRSLDDSSPLGPGGMFARPESDSAPRSWDHRKLATSLVKASGLE